MFSGSVIGMACRWPRDTVAVTMASSAGLSVMSHYLMEGQQKEAVANDVGPSCTLNSESNMAEKRCAEEACRKCSVERSYG